jgi:valyl-tRNA synthetase
MNVKPSQKLPIHIGNATRRDVQLLTSHADQLERLAGVRGIAFEDADTDIPGAATAIVGEMRVQIPLTDIIDVQAEAQRLDKQVGKLEVDIDKTARKLANDGFVSKAPPEVVTKERERLADLRLQAEQLKDQIERIRSLQ